MPTSKTKIKCCKLCQHKYFGTNNKCFGKPKLPICKVSSCNNTKKHKEEVRELQNSYLRWKRLKEKEDSAKQAKKDKKTKKWIFF